MVSYEQKSILLKSLIFFYYLRFLKKLFQNFLEYPRTMEYQGFTSFCEICLNFFFMKATLKINLNHQK